MNDYIMNILTASLICSIFVQITKKQSVTGDIVRILCGIFIALTVVSPLVQLRWNELTEFVDKIQWDAQTTISEGTQFIHHQKADSIQQKVQAYILDKAANCDCELSVKVELSDKDPPVPLRIWIDGTVSPYQKTQISEMIETDLGIPKEMQTWNAIS